MEYGSKKFNCPNCNTIAKQNWFNCTQFSDKILEIYQHNFLNYRKSTDQYTEEKIQRFLKYMESNLPDGIDYYFPKNLSIAKCHSCNKNSIWLDKQIIFPRNISVENPNSDLNEDIQILYYEAANIFNDSLKGATAILRLALQKLLIQLGKENKSINDGIKELVEEGLNPKMQQALDFLRVVGNNAVHPGQIDLDDNKEMALKLFKILNMIADDMITKPKDMNELYNDIIPEETRGHINQRDGNT